MSRMEIPAVKWFSSSLHVPSSNRISPRMAHQFLLCLWQMSGAVLWPYLALSSVCRENSTNQSEGGISILTDLSQVKLNWKGG